MSEAILCQSCGIEAPCKHVAFNQNIGALVMRFSRSVQGNLCKSCIHKHFWQMTLINATLGWWGMISAMVTPFFILGNIIHYIGALGLEPVPPGATAPVLTPDIVAKIRPYAQSIIERVNGGEQLVPVAQDIASRTGATPGQVVRCVLALSRQAPAQTPQSAGYSQQPVV